MVASGPEAEHTEFSVYGKEKEVRDRKTDYYFRVGYHCDLSILQKYMIEESVGFMVMLTYNSPIP